MARGVLENRDFGKKLGTDNLIPSIISPTPLALQEIFGDARDLSWTQNPPWFLLKVLQSGPMFFLFLQKISTILLNAPF